MVPFVIGTSLIQLSYEATRQRIPLAGPNIRVVSYWIQSMQVSFFKFSKVISASDLMTSLIYSLNLLWISGWFPIQQTIILKNLVVVSVPAIRKVWNSSISSVSVQENSSLLSSFSQIKASIISVHFCFLGELLTSSVLFFRIRAAFFRIKTIPSFTSLIRAVNPVFQAKLPKKTSKGVRVKSAALDIFSTMNQAQFLPFPVQSLIWSFPKKHFIITPLNMLADMFKMLYFTLFSPNLWLQSNLSQHLLQISTIFGILSLIRSKLKTLDKSFLLFFQIYPSLKSRPCYQHVYLLINVWGVSTQEFSHEIRVDEKDKCLVQDIINCNIHLKAGCPLEIFVNLCSLLIGLRKSKPEEREWIDVNSIPKTFKEIFVSLDLSFWPVVILVADKDSQDHNDPDNQYIIHQLYIRSLKLSDLSQQFFLKYKVNINLMRKIQ